MLQDPSSETLLLRLARGPVPLADLLTYAMDIAVALRDLHSEGRAHGAVRLEAIRVGTGGVTLAPAGAPAPSATPASDVSAFGAVLHAMLDALDVGGSMDARAKLRELQAWCQGASGHEPPGMHQVIVELRLAGMMARQAHGPAYLPSATPPAPVYPVSIHAELPSMPIPDYATPASFLGEAPRPEKPPVRPPQAIPTTGPVFRCPKCGSLDTRETPSRPILHRVLAFAGATYRCRACQARFLARRPWTPPPSEE